MLIDLDEAIEAVYQCRHGSAQALDEAIQHINQMDSLEEVPDYEFALGLVVGALKAIEPHRCSKCRFSYLDRSNNLRCKMLRRKVDESWSCADYEKWRMKQ